MGIESILNSDGRLNKDNPLVQFVKKTNIPLYEGLTTSYEVHKPEPKPKNEYIDQIKAAYYK